MLRSLLFLGAVVGVSTAIPALYQSNPQAFETVLKSVYGTDEPTDATTSEINLTTPAPGNIDQPLGRKVLLQQDQAGHFSAPFRVNGRQIDALVDTGATLVALTTSTARRVGISLNPSDFRHEVSTANGKIRGAAVTIARLQIGKINLDNVQAIVLDDRALQTNLIGMSFLGRLASYKAENGTLLLAQ
jgi:aspartyl protease family protein